MDRTFNRCAAPIDFDGQIARDLHDYVCDPGILDNQHPQRSWEYSQALFALEAWDRTRDRRHDPLLVTRIADIGGAGSNFWKALRHYTTKPVTGIDPNHEWNSDDEAAQHFRDTLHAFKTQQPTTQFDAVFCLSVIEHVPEADLAEFGRDLAALVRPDGLLVLTCDAGAAHPDVYHFHWMRQRIYDPDALRQLGSDFWNLGLAPLTEPDFTWPGPTVYDYGIASLALIKKG